jgi:hypothetical protein
VLSQEYIELTDLLVEVKIRLKEVCKTSKSYEDVVVKSRLKELKEHIEIVEEIIEGQIEFDLDLVNKQTADSF